MQFRPLQDRVLIKRVASEEQSLGGIIIPDTAREKPMEGEVVAVGPGARGEDGKIYPTEVKAGDRVLFGRWSGTELQLNGEELIILKESDIIADLSSTDDGEAVDIDESTSDELDVLFRRLDEGITTERRAIDHLLETMSANAPSS